MLATTQRPKIVPASGGLAGTSGAIHAATTLGVPPPPKPVQSQRIPIEKSAPAPSGKPWLLLGALLALAAGVLLALALFR